MARQLRQAGARVILAPVIKIKPAKNHSVLDKSLRHIDNFDTIIFTSANGVRHFFDRARILKLAPLPRPQNVFAIGSETASVLSAAGWPRAKTPSRFRGEALAKSLGRVKGRRILIPRALQAREVLPRALRRAGALVTLAEAYRTVPDASGIRRLRGLLPGGVDAVTFTSESTVRHFFAGLGRGICRKLFAQTAAASIGPVTTAALRREGCRPIQASVATSQSLCRALLDHYRNDK